MPFLRQYMDQMINESIGTVMKIINSNRTIFFVLLQPHPCILTLQ